MGQVVTVMHANWQICLDACVETYHLSTVHAATVGNIATSRENPNGRIDAVRLYPRHRIISATANGEHMPTGTEMLVRQFSGNATAAPDLEKAGQGLPPQVNPLKLPDWFADIMVLFPVSYITTLGGFYLTYDFWPISHDKTRWDMRIYMDPLKAVADDVIAEYNRIYMRDGNREDLVNLSQVL